MKYLAECSECDERLGVPNVGDRIAHHDDGSHTYIPDPVTDDDDDDDLEWCTLHRSFESAACVDSFDVNEPDLKALTDERLMQWFDYMEDLQHRAAYEIQHRLRTSKGAPNA